MTNNYQKVKSIILRLNQDDSIKNKIIIVKQENMSFIREYLKREELSVSDSLNLSYNKLHIDYGVDAVIDGIIVNFAPYEIVGNTIIQRNFLTKQSSGMDALATVTMKNIDVNNVFAEIPINGTMIHTYSLEMVKIMKQKSKKKMDLVDIEVIDDFGYDENVYFVLKEQLKDMKFTLAPRNKLLRFIFH